MTAIGEPRFNDTDVRRYLTARAEAVAASAVPADDMALRVAVDLRLVRPRRGAAGRVLRLAVVVGLLAALIGGALYLIGRQQLSYRPAEPKLVVGVHGSPWGLAALDGSIWAAGYIEPLLIEIQPSTGVVLDEVGTGNKTCGELAAAFGYLWFTSCPPNVYLSRMDPATNRIDRLNGYNGDQLGFGGGSLWTVHDGAVEALDPVTLETTASFPVNRGGLVLYALGSVWISDADGGVVARVDPVQRRIVAEITWEAPNGGPYPIHLVEAAGAIWVADATELGVYRIDPATNEATRVDVDLQPIDGTGFGDHALASGGGELWVREGEATLTRIDTATSMAAERIHTEGLGGGAFLVTDDALWYANLKGESVVGLQRP